MKFSDSLGLRGCFFVYGAGFIWLSGKENALGVKLRIVLTIGIGMDE